MNQLPKTGCPKPMDAGVSWDAVRLPAAFGARVLNELGDHCGAVIRDQHKLYWLVEPGAAADWKFPAPAQVRILGKNSFLVVPPVDCQDDRCICWERPVVNGRLLTSAQRLHAAMQTAVSDGAHLLLEDRAVRADAMPAHCGVCGVWAEDTAPSGEDHGSGSAPGARICLDCGRDLLARSTLSDTLKAQINALAERVETRQRAQGAETVQAPVPGVATDA